MSQTNAPNLSTVTSLMSIAAVIGFLAVNAALAWATKAREYRRPPGVKATDTDYVASFRVLAAGKDAALRLYWLGTSIAMILLFTAGSWTWAYHVGTPQSWLLAATLFAAQAGLAIVMAYGFVDLRCASKEFATQAPPGRLGEEKTLFRRVKKWWTDCFGTASSGSDD